MHRILFLAHRIPYPPNKGDKIRSWHILKALAAAHEVHLGAFVDTPEDWRHVDTLQALCADTKFVGLEPRKAKLKSLRAIPERAPLSLGYYRSPEMADWVAGKLHPLTGIDRIFLFSSPMAQFVLDRPLPAPRMVMDFVDLDSDKWAQYAASRRPPMKWIYAREARTLQTYEKRVAAAANASLFVSAREAAQFQEIAPESAAKVHAVNNGVDHDYFSPDRRYANPYDGGSVPIVFTGAMDYWANIDAVTWFAREVLPRVREKEPEAHFYIVGGRPAPAVRALAALSGVTVTGNVPDVRPYLAHARVVAAPLRIARGVQNKVLEGMAMARPVVATGPAIDGIDCLPGRELMQADTADALAEACLAAARLAPDDPLPMRARARILASYDWGQNLGDLARFLDLEPLASGSDGVPETAAAS